MPVAYQTPHREEILPIPGIKIGITKAGINKKDRPDLTLIALEPKSTVVGVFTQNRFCAAPVQVCRAHLADAEDIRALVINTGNANAGTGEVGLAAAYKTCDAVAAQLLGINPIQVLPFSTGVILEPLPVDRLIAALPQAVENLSADHWYDAAHAIMTTDTVAKVASARITLEGKTITITGIAKGSGMIAPNMATMLGFIGTDVGVYTPLLKRLIKEVADESFNAITVDGDTSTNDSFIVMATGKSGLQFVDGKEAGFDLFKAALTNIAKTLAQAIVRDGEGATKFMTILVEDGRTTEECRSVAYSIAHSPLVKTAFFASDPNLGRILAAIGYAKVESLKVEPMRVWLGSEGEEILIAEKGGRAVTYREEDGARLMKSPEITIRVDLARGEAKATVYTCDFSYDYVKINADYRS